MVRNKIIVELFFFFFTNYIFCQQSITTPGVAITQNFDGIGTSGIATLPTGWKMGTDWSTGVSATTQTAGTSGTGAIGSTSAGGFYNFANGVTTTSTERALGLLSTGSYSSPKSIIYAFTNNTGNSVSSISISWDYEKYRSSSRAFDWTFFHGSTSTASTAELTGNQSYSADAANTTVSNPPISVSKSISLTGLSIANGSTYYLRWTYTGTGGSSNGQGLAIDNFSIILGASCPTPTALSFQIQPSSVLQNNVMSPSVTVAAICADGSVATSYSGTVMLSVNALGCGYISQTVSFVNGVGTFSNIVFTRSPQTNLTFTASSTNLTSTISNSFNVTAPLGSPTTSTIILNDFDSQQNWNYTVGTATSYGSGGTAGTDVVQIVNVAGTNVLAKSYSADNASNDKGSINTVTFSNVAGLGVYNLIEFTFNVFSFGSGTGAGMDKDEDFNLDISTDGGNTWETIINEYGWSDRLFAQSTSPVTSLSLSSVSNFPSLPLISSSSDTKSAFKLSLSSISQFQFRFKAKNNRTNENWAIDNPALVGISYGIGTPFNLPIADAGADVWLCSGSSTQLNATVSSYQNPVTYAWSPSAFLSNTSISNPSANNVSITYTYTLTITDADNCTALDQVAVNVISPPTILAISPP